LGQKARNPHRLRAFFMWWGLLMSACLSRQAARANKQLQQGWRVAGTTAEGLARRVQVDAQWLRSVIRTHHITAQ